MTTRTRHLTRGEIAHALSGETGSGKALLSVKQFSELTGVPQKTIYYWITRGRLDGAYRKRGKRIMIIGERALKLLFNGPEWK